MLWKAWTWLPKGQRSPGGSGGHGEEGARPSSPWLVQVTPWHQPCPPYPPVPLLVSLSLPCRRSGRSSLAPVLWILSRLLPDFSRSFHFRLWDVSLVPNTHPPALTVIWQEGRGLGGQKSTLPPGTLAYDFGVETRALVPGDMFFQSCPLAQASRSFCQVILIYLAWQGKLGNLFNQICRDSPFPLLRVHAGYPQPHLRAAPFVWPHGSTCSTCQIHTLHWNVSLRGSVFPTRLGTQGKDIHLSVFNECP